MLYVQLTWRQRKALLKLIDFYFQHRKEINGQKEVTELDISIQAIRNKIVEI